MPRRGLAVAAALALLLAGCGRDGAADGPPPIRVAAAASLALAFEELGALFTADTGRPVVFSFGSTGLLARQIRGGAPFDLFVAANVAFVDEVVAAGVCDGATAAPYARGRLAIWWRAGGVFDEATRGTSCGKPGADIALVTLNDPKVGRVAIANPEHAPYGQAAREVLEYLGMWGEVSPRLVFGENVRQAHQFVATGNADAAIIALALVVGDDEHRWELIDEDHHRPLDQALVVCGGGADAAGGAAFAAFIGSDTGRAVMRRHGFFPPGEPASAR